MSDIAHNKKIAASFLEAIENGDIGAVDRLLADDGDFWVIGQHAIAGNKTKREFLPLVQNMIDIMGNMKFHVEHVVAEGDKVAVAARGEMCTKTGVPYNNTYHFLLCVRDGKIQSSREYFDTELMIRVFDL